MQACTYSHHYATPSLTTQPVPVPNTAAGQVLVKVYAAAINPIDHVTHKGTHYFLFNFKWPRTFGFDFAGVVEKGDDGNTFKTGDRVFGQIAGLPHRGTGTIANYLIVHSNYCVPIPDNLSFVEAAAMPLVSITAMTALLKCGIKEKIAGKNRVLITGGAGGVGSQAIQMAKKIFNAATVVTTASAGKKEKLCKDLGADSIINYRENDFEKLLIQNGSKFDIILDCTGEAWKCLSLLEDGGSMCSITTGPTIEAMRTWLSGAGSSPDDGAPTMALGIRGFIANQCGGGLINYFAGGASLQKACKAKEASFYHLIGAPQKDGVLKAIASYLKDGKLQPVIDKVFPFDKCVEAITYQKTGRCAGKVVIEIAH